MSFSETALTALPCLDSPGLALTALALEPGSAVILGQIAQRPTLWAKGSFRLEWRGRVSERGARSVIATVNREGQGLGVMRLGARGARRFGSTRSGARSVILGQIAQRPTLWNPLDFCLDGPWRLTLWNPLESCLFQKPRLTLWNPLAGRQRRR